MKRYSTETIDQIRKLRSLGRTYGEIQRLVGLKIPKSTLSGWCIKVRLPKNYSDRIRKLNLRNLGKGRLIALEINKIKREEIFNNIKKRNMPLVKKMNSMGVAKIALSMLCLGEASKYNPITKCAFSLGNSDPRIIVIFLELLKRCFNFNLEKVRCTVQCRADQNTIELEKYWQEVTGIPKRLFYKSRIDPRTIGKPTKKRDYKGVLRVDYFERNVQYELETLAELVYNNVLKRARGIPVTHLDGIEK